MAESIKKALPGNHQCRLFDENVKLIKQFFEEALKPSPAPLKFYFDKYVREAENQCIPAISLKTFYQRFKNFESIYERTRKQKRQRAAYSLGPQPMITVNLEEHSAEVFGRRMKCFDTLGNSQTSERL